MFKGRGPAIIVVLLLIGVAIYLLVVRRPSGTTLLRPLQDNLPLDLRDVIPADWDPVAGAAKECNFDDDPEQEWFVVYRYDETKVAQPFRTPGAQVDRGPIGAAIFDTQSAVPDAPGNPSPYRPNLLIPYRLLPDFYAGKGQGYLGEDRVEPFFHSTGASGAACQVDEVGILGYSNGDLPTKLSLFRWQGRATGYKVAHFTGDARVAADIATDGSALVRTVTTFNRMSNHRSLLCESRTYTRIGSDASLVFREEPGAYTLDFCFGPPNDPLYPEGVVVALLRGAAPTARRTGAAQPPTAGFLLKNAELGFQLPTPGGSVSIFSVTNQAAVESDPDGGTVCGPEQAGPPATPELRWLCGRERAEVQTDIVLDGRVRQARWQLVSVVPDRVDADVFWRVEAVILAP